MLFDIKKYHVSIQIKKRNKNKNSHELRSNSILNKNTKNTNPDLKSQN